MGRPDAGPRGFPMISMRIVILTTDNREPYKDL